MIVFTYFRISQLQSSTFYVILSWVSSPETTVEHVHWGCFELLLDSFPPLCNQHTTIEYSNGMLYMMVYKIHDINHIIPYHTIQYNTWMIGWLVSWLVDWLIDELERERESVSQSWKLRWENSSYYIISYLFIYRYIWYLILSMNSLENYMSAIQSLK